MRNNLLKLTFLLALVAIAGFAFAPSSISQAASNNYSGDTTGAATWNRPFANGTCCSGLGPVTYEIEEMWVDADGNYTFNSVQSFDGYVFLYIGSFDPLNQTLNFVVGDDDGPGGIGTSEFNATLVANTTYIIVTSAFAAGDEGTYTNTVTGTGNIYFGPVSPVSPVVPEIVVVPTDGRLNPMLGDATEVVLYPSRDDDGNQTIQAYCVSSDALGYLGMVISSADLPENAPAENTLLATSDVCNIEFWALAEGSEFRYQLNVGPNTDGTVTELLFNDITAANLEMRSFNLYALD